MSHVDSKHLGPFRFVVSVFSCYTAGFIGSFFMGVGVATWYPTLQKPPFALPDWMFGSVWMLLYALIAIAVLVVWNTGLHRERERLAFGLFFFQLLFNLLWVVVFFGGHQLIFGLFIIVILWVMVYSLVLQFYKIDWFAGTLLIPYWAWLTYALVLNFFLWLYNR